MFRKTPPLYLPPAPTGWPDNFTSAWRELVNDLADRLTPNKRLLLELAARELTVLREGDPEGQTDRARLLLGLLQELRRP